MKHINIAIDGPSGVGKTTVSKMTAESLGYVYVDTGAMFRTFAVYFSRNNTDVNDEKKVGALLGDIDVKIKYSDKIQHMLLNGEDVTDMLRTEEISRTASVISRYKEVRSRLLEAQRKIAAENSVVMDGRDIGTVVLPGADVKVFLTARPEIRAKRRYDELKKKNKLCGATLEEIERDITERDYRDSHREIAPLKPAEDAVIIDTSDITAEEVSERIKGMVHEG